MIAIEIRQFRDAKSGGEEELEYGAITEGFRVTAICRRDESHDFVVFEVVDLTHGGFADLNLFGGDAFDIIFGEKLEK
jgi:hypothetical protein